MSPASPRPARGGVCHRSAGADGDPRPRQRGPSRLWGGLRAGDHRQRRGWGWGSGSGRPGGPPPGNVTHGGPGEMARPWGRSPCCGRGLTGAVRPSLCPRRRRPHHLLLQLPATPRPARPHRLRLRHQQPLRQAGSDVSAHRRPAGGSGCDGRGSALRVAGRGTGTGTGRCRQDPAQAPHGPG